VPRDALDGGAQVQPLAQALGERDRQRLVAAGDRVRRRVAERRDAGEVLRRDRIRRSGGGDLDARADRLAHRRRLIEPLEQCRRRAGPDHRIAEEVLDLRCGGAQVVRSHRGAAAARLAAPVGHALLP
jgi:hypothetical protein